MSHIFEILPFDRNFHNSSFYRYFNKTRFSGLETHIANSYMNPLLQMYKFTPLLRNLALQHTATSCTKEDCMLCQMGFLFDMLDKANGQNCQATNFLKTFSSLPTGVLSLVPCVITMNCSTDRDCPIFWWPSRGFSCSTRCT